MKIMISACLAGENCKYNGGNNRNEKVLRLMAENEVITVCPEQITSGIAADKKLQKQSLAWIREQSLDPDCIESLANHDPDIAPHVIEL